MPTYDYHCTECGETFEHFQPMTSSVLTQKPGCKDEKCVVIRIISGGTGLIFKGSGFYLTDYKKKDKVEKSKTETESKPKTTTKTKTGETKT
jgi:putative FmdB family regulatory protein